MRRTDKRYTDMSAAEKRAYKNERQNMRRNLRGGERWQQVVAKFLTALAPSS